jgi:hypothetical protein
MKRKHKFVVYGLNPQFTEIVVLKQSTDADYETFLKEFPNDQCRWAVYDLEYEVEDGGKRNKVVFVYWCASPVCSRDAHGLIVIYVQVAWPVPYPSTHGLLCIQQRPEGASRCRPRDTGQ